MRKIKWLDFGISIAVAEFVGIISSLLSGNNRQIYQTLNQPPLSPPGWVFPIVWAILYATMGIAAYLVFNSTESTKQDKTRALTLYATQLLVNFMWSIIFFRFEAYGAAVVVIILLDILVALTIKTFKKINPTAAYVLVPYFIWILFATYLNIVVYLLNR